MDRKNGPKRLNKRISFQGSKLIMIAGGRRNSAREVIVTFSNDFQSCSVDSKIGYAGGDRTGVGLDGVRYNILSSTISNRSCSIEAGNAFAH
jgi:hypothetical protein